MTQRRTPLARDAKIAFMSPCGWGNLGDAAIIDSLIHGVRRRLPEAKLVGFTMKPDDTTARHAVEAHTLLGFSRPLYTMVEHNGISTGSSPHREARHLSRSFTRLRGASMLVVAGGGQLDDLWGGAWGHPYALLRFGLLARATGARFVFASVGTGQIGTPMARLLLRRALALADYRSFRDDRSRDLVGASGATPGDPTVPDLAYGRPVQVLEPPRRAKMVIGISPMTWCHPTQWPSRDVQRYQRHVGSFGALAARLLKEGHQVVLYTTGSEPAVLEDTIASMGELPSDARARLSVAETPTVDALFGVLGGVDAVVAARLHGVLLAHLAHRPVLAVSHERKVRTLMQDNGLAHYSVEIDDFDPDQGFARLQELLAARDEVSERVATGVAKFRARVEAQYDFLFGPSTA